jgi:hypothetical protein
LNCSSRPHSQQITHRTKPKVFLYMVLLGARDGQ